MFLKMKFISIFAIKIKNDTSNVKILHLRCFFKLSFIFYLVIHKFALHILDKFVYLYIE